MIRYWWCDESDQGFMFQFHVMTSYSRSDAMQGREEEMIDVCCDQLMQGLFYNLFFL